MAHKTSVTSASFRVLMAGGRGGTSSCFSTPGSDGVCDFQFGSHHPAGSTTSCHTHTAVLLSHVHTFTPNCVIVRCKKMLDEVCFYRLTFLNLMCTCSCTALWEGEPWVPEEWPPCCDSGVCGKRRRLHRHHLQESGQAEGQGKWLRRAAAELRQRLHHSPPRPGPHIWWWVWKEEPTQVSRQNIYISTAVHTLYCTTNSCNCVSKSVTPAALRRLRRAPLKQAPAAPPLLSRRVRLWRTSRCWMRCAWTVVTWWRTAFCDKCPAWRAGAV